MGAVSSDTAAHPLPEVEQPAAARMLAGLRRSKWILWRLAFGVLTLLLVSILIFLATSVLPGDAARAILGYDASDAAVAELRAQLGLDRSPLAQHISWLGGVLQGDLGMSLTARQPVIDLVGPRAVNTAALLVVSLVVAVPLSLLLGCWTAVRRDGLLDRVVQGAALVLMAVPDFIVGLILVLVFATTVLHLLPAVTMLPFGESAFQHPNVLILPAATIVIALVPYLILMVRAAMIDALESEYVEMARLKGVRERRIVFMHALPNALAPILQALALATAWTAGGIVVVEFLFNYPGLGSGIANAIASRDVPMIQAIALILATLIVVTNLIADVLTVLTTPRLRTEPAR